MLLKCVMCILFLEASVRGLSAVRQPDLGGRAELWSPGGTSSGDQRDAGHKPARFKEKQLVEESARCLHTPFIICKT